MTTQSSINWSEKPISEVADGIPYVSVMKSSQSPPTVSSIASNALPDLRFGGKFAFSTISWNIGRTPGALV